MLYQLIMQGRLSADPEMRYMGNGDPVTNFRVAVDVGFKDNKQTHWWNCAAFGKLSEVAANFLHKGDFVTLVGQPKADKDTGVCRIYEQEGQWRGTLEMIANQIILAPKSMNERRTGE